MLRSSVQIISVLVAALFLGCDGTSSPAPSPSAATDSPSDDSGDTDGTVKIAVMVDGTVYVNAEEVPIDSLSSKLDEIGEIKEIWYHREAPEAEEPHENAMKAIAEIANRQRPIAMYLDREFKQRANVGGQ
jgi:biopolymer transport protein ExbD